MIDLKALRDNPGPYLESAQLRGLKLDLEKLTEADAERVRLVGEVDSLRGALNKKGKPEPEELQRLHQQKQKLADLEAKLRQADQLVAELAEKVPNILAPGTPSGGEESNQQEREWGQKPKFDFSLQEHNDLAEARGWLDFDRGAKVAGSKFYFYMGALVKLEMAVKRLALEVAEEAGFIPVDVPHLVNSRVAAGTGFNPRGPEQQIYTIEGEDLHLIATAEMPLTGYHADEILEELPKCYAGWSPSYRREAGSYGKHSKGLFRVHQFNKLELYVLCRAEDSDEWLNRLVELEEKICQQLELPYRVTRTAAGDMGAPHYQKFDVEYWSPVENCYRELMSASNCTDYQSRRLGIRTRQAGGATEYVHTLNATAAAISRIFIALIENHQQADGSVQLPAALKTFYAGDKL